MRGRSSATIRPSTRAGQGQIVRFRVGLADVDDLTTDLEQGSSAAPPGRPSATPAWGQQRGNGFVDKPLGCAGRGAARIERVPSRGRRNRDARKSNAVWIRRVGRKLSRQCFEGVCDGSIEDRRPPRQPSRRPVLEKLLLAVAEQQACLRWMAPDPLECMAGRAPRTGRGTTRAIQCQEIALLESLHRAKPERSNERIARAISVIKRAAGCSQALRDAAGRDAFESDGPSFRERCVENRVFLELDGPGHVLENML